MQGPRLRGRRFAVVQPVPQGGVAGFGLLR